MIDKIGHGRRALRNGLLQLAPGRGFVPLSHIHNLCACCCEAPVILVALCPLYDDLASRACLRQCVICLFTVQCEHRCRADRQTARSAIRQICRLVARKTRDGVSRFPLHFIEVHTAARYFLHGTQTARAHATCPVFGESILCVDIAVNAQFFKDVHVLYPFSFLGVDMFGTAFPCPLFLMIIQVPAFVNKSQSLRYSIKKIRYPHTKSDASPQLKQPGKRRLYNVSAILQRYFFKATR